MNQEKYIERIGFNGQISTEIDCLRHLHRYHVMSVPFEALDVLLKRKIQLDLPRVYNKVVLQKRGGYCYELNFLFHALLSKLGFDSTMVSSRIFDDESYGPEFDHMALVVRLQEPWLVDVGYGDLFIEPLKIYSENIQEDYFKKYKIERLDESRFVLLASLKNRLDFKKRYIFDLEPRKIEEFSEQNYVKQFSADSYFVKNTVCTMPTQNGRKTILNNLFKVRTDNQVRERVIKDNNELVNLLCDEFDITLTNAAYSSAYYSHTS